MLRAFKIRRKFVIFGLAFFLTVSLVTGCNRVPTQDREKGKRCICGSDKSIANNQYKWTLQIRGSQGICSGTIVTSDFVITSSQCLASVTGSKNTDKGDLSVSGHNGERFGIREIIRNDPSDQVILQLSADFLSHKFHLPVCVLEGDHTKHSIIHHPAIFTDIIDTDDGRLVYLKREGVILRGKECDTEATFNVDQEENLLCMRFPGLALGPNFPGGALLVKSKTGRKQIFLIGFAVWVAVRDEISGTGYNYVYFTNGLPLIRQLEKIANKADSKWCTTPKLKMPPAENDGILGGPWPYENQDLSLHRDESLDCICGLQNNGRMIGRGRVAGGVQSKPYEFGWMTKLIFNWDDGRLTLCGATIINDRMILTGAHCVVSETVNANRRTEFLIEPGKIEAYIGGAHELWYDEMDKQVAIKTVIFWPEYAELRMDYRIHDYDLALLITEEPMEFSSDTTGSGNHDIRPICLPERNKELNLIGETAWVVGWGFTNPEVHNVSDKLNKVDVPIQPLSYCEQVAPDETFTERMICAGTNNKWKDSSKGDSGGPLQRRRPDGLWIQQGVVSWGKEFDASKTGGATSISLYTNIQKLVSFVDYNAKRIGAKWCRSTKS